MRILRASDSSVMAIFGDEASLAAHRRVLHLFHRLAAAADPRIRNIHPAYCSVLVDFDPLRMPHEELIGLIEGLTQSPVEESANAPQGVVIPVCYDTRLAPDLHAVAERCGITTAEVIRLHTSADYFVSFLGFSPGFGYLTGLPEQLAAPRLVTPRKLVSAGSVGIAGKQTGVYPIDSPGGWNIIGRTPLRMFDPETSPPAVLKYGDSVRFEPIDYDEFEARSRGRE
jgi:KipI family sensor histidine kinase inhibitor